jgi:Sigma-70 region 2
MRLSHPSWQATRAASPLPTTGTRILYTYCQTLLRDPADAAAAVLDTFVIAAARLDRLRDPDRLRAWLYAVARNEALRQGAPALGEAPDVTDDSVGIGHDAGAPTCAPCLRTPGTG